jgi:vitamin B12 transporter
MHEPNAPVGPGLLKPIFAAIVATCAAAPQIGYTQSTTVQRPDVIVVTSSRIEQPRRQIGTAVSVIDFDDIELRGYVDLADVLRTQTGIAVTNTGGAGKATSVRIRGEETFRTLLMIDGVKTLDPSAPQVSPTFNSLLTTNYLQRVEVLRGPQGFMYGADAGGVVNVITKRGADELGGQVGIELGEYALRKVDAAVAGGSDKGDYFVSVVDVETDGFSARPDDTVLRDDDGADNTTVHAKLGWNVADSLRLQLVARDVDAEAAYDRCLHPVTFATRHDCVGMTDQSTYKVSAEHSAGNVSNSVGYSNIETVRDDFAAGLPAFASKGQIGRLEYTGSYKPSDEIALVYGLDFQDEELTDRDDFAPIGVPRERSRDQKGYYAEYQGAFDDALFVSLGARYDDNDDFGSHTSTRLSAAYVQDLGSERSIKYRTSIGTGFRAPSLYEIKYNSGPNSFPPAAGLALTEESSEGFDVGLEYAAANGLRLEVTYFDQQIEDEIFFDLVNFSGYLQSTGTSTSKGIEVGADVPLGERWELLANWTNNDADSSTSVPRLQRPKNLGNLGLRYRAANERLSLIANFRMARDSVDIGFVALEDYEVLDLSVSYDASEKLQIYGRVQNATDETYEEAVGFNAAQRSMYGGVRLRF